MLTYMRITGVYGDVHRVKIMFNKKDNALVQFADAMQAQQGELIILVIASCGRSRLSEGCIFKHAAVAC